MTQEELDSILPPYTELEKIRNQINVLINASDSISKYLAYMFNEIRKLPSEKYDYKVSIDLMFRNILKLADSVSPLILYGKTTTINIVQRSILDSIFQFLYLIQKDHYLRGMCYLYCVYRDRIRRLDSHFEFSKSKVGIRNEFPKMIKDQTKKIQAEKKDFQNRLKNDSFNIVREHAIDEKSLKKKDWYTIVDHSIQNIEQLANRVDKGATYHILFKLLSKDVHALNVLKNSYIHDEKGLIYYDVRFPFELKESTNQYLGTISSFILKVTEEFLPFTMEEWRNWYKNEWKPIKERVDKLQFP